MTPAAPAHLLAAATDGAAGFGDLLVGMPVAAVVVTLALISWRLLDKGRLVLGREHDELRDDRDFWRSVALRALNISEAAVGRRDPDRHDLDGLGPGP